MNIINEYIKKHCGNKYLPLAPTDKSRGTLKKEKIWGEIIDLNRSTHNNSDSYDEIYISNLIKYKSNSIQMTSYLKIVWQKKQ